MRPRKARSWRSSSDDAKTGALVEVNSETDFVARNEEFGALAQAVATQLFGDASFDGVVTMANEGEFMTKPWHKDAGKSVSEAVKEASGKTGENVVLRRYARFTTDGVIGSVRAPQRPRRCPRRHRGWQR